MRDIGAIVSEQSPIIANVEQTVIAANDHIITGNNQLTSAAKHQVDWNFFLNDNLYIHFVVLEKVSKETLLSSGSFSRYCSPRRSDRSD